jgi:hypothetical protein
MKDIILVTLAGFGACWIILALMVLNFGGSIKVTVINPITKKRDILTDYKNE